MRVLNIHYRTFVEIVKEAHPTYFKELPSLNQVLLDLKNTPLNN